MPNHEPKDDIFEAINQVLKYIACNHQLAIDAFYQSLKAGNVYTMVQLCYPIIVFDGSLYTGHFVDGRIKIKDANHVILQYQFHPEYTNELCYYYIDVVKKEYFETFFKRIEEERNMLMDCVSLFHNQLITDVRSFVQP